jgi:hypothetical protein
LIGGTAAGYCASWVAENEPIADGKYRMGVPAARRQMFFRTSQRDRRGDVACLVPSGDFKTSETSALMKETAKNALPNRDSPTAITRQTTQPTISRLDNPPNMRHRGIGKGQQYYLHCLQPAQKGSSAFTL